MDQNPNSVINNQQIVVKSNRLIETGYKLGKREQFFMLYLISRLDSMRQNDFRHYEMSFIDIKRILNYDGVKRLANRDTVFEIMNNLNRTPIYWEKKDDDGQLEEKGQMTWISSLKYSVKKDMFTFAFDSNLKPFLLQLEEYFTKYALHNIKNFSKSHSIRMYEILKVYERQRRVELTVEKLKFYLGVGDKYDKFYELKRWVLEPTKEELRVFTDIRFEYRPAKKHRKTVLSVEFFIYPNRPNTNELAEGEDPSLTLFDDLYKSVKDWGVTKKAIKSYLVKYSPEYIRKRIDYVEDQIDLKKAKGESIRNLAGYLHRMMGENELFEYREKAEQKKAAQYDKIKEVESNKKALEAKVKKLRGECFTKEEELIQQLFKSDKKLKSSAIKTTKLTKRKYYKDDLTPSQNFEKVRSFRMAVYEYIRGLYPADFKAIQSEYKTKIAVLKEQIKQL